jgi:hypothetical protein
MQSLCRAKPENNLTCNVERSYSIRAIALPYKSDNMALDTFTRLTDAAKMLRGTSEAISFSVIKDRITEFNRAKTKEEKDKILKSIEADFKAIREERERLKRPTTEVAVCRKMIFWGS